MELTVQRFVQAGGESLALKVVSGTEHLDRKVPEPALNRPGLALAGFFRYFAFRRIQVFGQAELAYLSSLIPAEQVRRLQKFFRRAVPCVVVARPRRMPDVVLELARKHGVPVLRTGLVTGRFMNRATVLLEDLTGPRVHAQGTMVEVEGIGVLLEGEPGIGKSEIALTLIEHGHSLVADDITVLRLTAAGVIVGAAVELTRYHMEIRGLGIIHVPSLFGVTAMRGETRLDLIVRLRRQEESVEEDRTSFVVETRDILGVQVPVIHLPVGAGRDAAHLVEVAARNQKLRQLGHDAAKELDEKLIDVLVKRHEQSG